MQFADFPTDISTVSAVRPPAVAGTFYPENTDQLQMMVMKFLKGACGNDEGCGDGTTITKAIIAPHAGYIYSGPIAGVAYSRLASDDYPIKRIILLGPAHFVPVHRLAISSAAAFATPLGMVPIDENGRTTALGFPQVVVSDEAHEPEHCLEVQLPFLQTVCCDFSIIPLLVGNADAEDVAQVLDALWDRPGTRIVVSSDLSHYLGYETARQADMRTARTIAALEPGELTGESACGRTAIQGLLQIARQHCLTAQTLDLRNSGDTAGPRDRVVGYGAFAFEEKIA
ncbi:MAG: AmmeMemoRadiSam system protein B [Chloroflexota bacterium]